MHGFLVIALVAVLLRRFVGKALEDSSRNSCTYQKGNQTNACDDDVLKIHASLVAPSSVPYRHLVNGVETRISRTSLDRWVDKIFNGSRNLFVVESGAHDGVFDSNSLFLEVKRQWSCLLVEGNPILLEELLERQRQCYVLQGGLSITGDLGSFKFALRGAMGGIVQTMSRNSDEVWLGHMKAAKKQHRHRRAASSMNRSDPMLARGRNGGIVDVPCFPLHLVLRALGRDVVDYWSLDTEGSEADIIEHTDFNEVEIGVLTVEHAKEEHRLRRIRTVMERNGFKRVEIGLEGEDCYASPRYFVRRNLQFPGGIQSA